MNHRSLTAAIIIGLGMAYIGCAQIIGADEGTLTPKASAGGSQNDSGAGGTVAAGSAGEEQGRTGQGGDGGTAGSSSGAGGQAGQAGGSGGTGGECVDPNRQCPSGCVNIKTDPNNCGDCNHKCDTNYCAGAKCRTAPLRLGTAGGDVVDIAVDPFNGTVFLLVESNIPSRSSWVQRVTTGGIETNPVNQSKTEGTKANMGLAVDHPPQASEGYLFFATKQAVGTGSDVRRIHLGDYSVMSKGVPIIYDVEARSGQFVWAVGDSNNSCRIEVTSESDMAPTVKANNLPMVTKLQVSDGIQIVALVRAATSRKVMYINPPTGYPVDIPGTDTAYDISVSTNWVFSITRDDTTGNGAVYQTDIADPTNQKKLAAGVPWGSAVYAEMPLGVVYAQDMGRTIVWADMSGSGNSTPIGSADLPIKQLVLSQGLVYWVDAQNQVWTLSSTR